MLQALLSDETLHPDVVAARREAYSLAITHVCFHESEYLHVSPRSIVGKLREADCVPYQPGGARSSENPGHRPYRASIEEMKTPLHDGLICSSSFIAAQIGFFVSSHARVRPLT
jgi:hypothetical protein